MILSIISGFKSEVMIKFHLETCNTVPFDLLAGINVEIWILPKKIGYFKV